MLFFFFQAEDGIRDLVRSRGLGDVYKRQMQHDVLGIHPRLRHAFQPYVNRFRNAEPGLAGYPCLLYTSDAADDLLCVDLGGRRIIKKKKQTLHIHYQHPTL